jgi:Holliday junction DNA helicase RuvA
MIGSLRGTLVHRTDDEILLEVAGVGYRVLVAPATAVTIGDLNEDVYVHVHHNIREDSQALYGFATRDERDCFEALLGAHGVGPALALAILSVHDPVALQRALADDDIAALCLVPGVGKKTAARLLVELKSKLNLPMIDLTEPVRTQAGPNSRTDVREALGGLGYSADEIHQVLRDLPEDTDDSGALLKQALRRLAASP